MATFNVSNTTQLQAAINTAADGDVISLASGTYSGMNIFNKSFANGITITSADSAHPAVLNAMNMNGSSGITISNIEFSEVNPGAQYGFRIGSSQNITLDHLNIHGPSGFANYQNVNPVMIQNSDGVTLSNSEIHDANMAVSVLGSDHVTVSNNYFHDLRKIGRAHV